MTYDEELDEWICANNKRLTFSSRRTRKSENGYESIKRTYMCTDCQGCPLRSSCAKEKDTKSISVSMKNQKQRQEVREKLSSEEGEKKYKQRKIEVEPVFGQIKYNSHFQRFTLRGLSKTTVEWGLICVAHNLKKWATSTEKHQKVVESNGG